MVGGRYLAAQLPSWTILLPERRVCLQQSVLDSLAWLLSLFFFFLCLDRGAGVVGRGMSWFCDINCHPQLFVLSVELFILQDKLLIFNFVQQMPGQQVEMESEPLGSEPQTSQGSLKHRLPVPKNYSGIYKGRTLECTGLRMKLA